MDEDFICPMVWKWSDIYEKLVAEWNSHPEHDDIPEPPHMLAPNATDNARKQRWLDTVEWAESNGIQLPELAEHEKHYRL
ncbi:MAG: hypothetical protein ACOVP2_10950 [Armatimonadaceae bacterium]